MPALALDDRNRCPVCDIKPWRQAPSANSVPYFFCPGCDRAYDAETKLQIANWAWVWDLASDDFVPQWTVR